MTALTEQDGAILELARRFYARPGSMESAIVTELEMTTTRYYQLLNLLIDDPKALEHDPMLVRRLQRIRAQRHRRRAG